jgi:hypothetical protein
MFWHNVMAGVQQLDINMGCNNNIMISRVGSEYSKYLTEIYVLYIQVCQFSR